MILITVQTSLKKTALVKIGNWTIKDFQRKSRALADAHTVWSIYRFEKKINH